MIRNALFDLDGTLLDTSEGILESVAYAVKDMGFHELTREEMLTFIGPPIPTSFRRIYGCDDDITMKATASFRDHYREHGLMKAKPYDGIYDLMDILKSHGIKTAAATYKREDYAVKLLNHFGFGKYFYTMHGADSQGVLTKSDIINICLSEMGGNSDNSVLIGDSEYDAKGAEGAGIPFIGVTYGFGFRSEHDVDAYKNIGTAGSPADVARIIISQQS